MGKNKKLLLKEYPFLLEQYPLLDKCEIIKKDHLKKLFSARQILVDKDLVNDYFKKEFLDEYYIHTQRALQTIDFDDDDYNKYGFKYVPIYDVFEPYSDKEHPSKCAFSILDDTYHYKKGVTILSIGFNPAGDDDNKEANSKTNKDEKGDKPKSCENIPSILKNDCGLSLEKTRANIFKHAYCTPDIRKPIKRLVQTDLFIERTTSANELKDSSHLSDTNFENIEFWMNQADIIVPNWGGNKNIKKLEKSKNFQQLIKDLNDDYISKVYVINFNQHGSPTHSASRKENTPHPLKKVGKISEQGDKFFPAP